MSIEKEFGEYLKKLRKEKGLTIRQLEEKSRVSNAYLSQIENGKRGLPSPEILKKIHGPLEVGYDELMERAGYISHDIRSELLPETIQTIESFDTLSNLIEHVKDMYYQLMQDEIGRLKEEHRENFIKTAYELYGVEVGKEVEELIDTPDFANKMFETLTIEEKIEFLNMLIDDFVENGIDPKEVFNQKNKINKENSISIIKVPVLGYIAAGQPILAEEHIEEWTEIPNMWNLKDGEVFILKVKGDSMIGSRIFEGDRVVIKLQPDVENGEIAAVNVNGYEATLKRVKKTEDGQVILYPDNPRYDPIFIKNENARIIGKVIQVMFEPK